MLCDVKQYFPTLYDKNRKENSINIKYREKH